MAAALGTSTAAMRMTNAVLPHMRAQDTGRVGTAYACFSSSPDVLLVEPGYTSTAFEANTQWSDAPLPAYADQRVVVLAFLPQTTISGTGAPVLRGPGSR